MVRDPWTPFTSQHVSEWVLVGECAGSQVISDDQHDHDQQHHDDGRTAPYTTEPPAKPHHWRAHDKSETWKETFHPPVSRQRSRIHGRGVTFAAQSKDIFCTSEFAHRSKNSFAGRLPSRVKSLWFYVRIHHTKKYRVIWCPLLPGTCTRKVVTAWWEGMSCRMVTTQPHVQGMPIARTKVTQSNIMLAEPTVSWWCRGWSKYKVHPNDTDVSPIQIFLSLCSKRDPKRNSRFFSTIPTSTKNGPWIHLDLDEDPGF